MKLDLRYRGELNPEVSVIFNEIASKSRKPFTQLVDNLSLRHNNLDWWVESPASRNTLVSPFFHYFCALHLVSELISKNYTISEIIVDSIAFRRILKKYFHSKNQSIIVKNDKNPLTNFIKNFFKPFVKIPIELFNRIYQIQCCRKTRFLQKQFPTKPLKIIDVFCFPGFVTEDRYYNGLWESLDSEQKKTTFFVPTIVMMPKNKITAIYKELRSSERNFMIKEDFLTIRDLIYAVCHYFRTTSLHIDPVVVLGVDISRLVKEELNGMGGYSGAVEAILNYCFAKNLKEHGIKIDLVIDWFENNFFDRGWNAGFRKFYPESQIVGYKGYINIPFHLSLYPTEVENISMVIPNKIAVIGNGLVDSTKEFFPDLNVVISPAFRFNHLWDATYNKPDTCKFRILVALSITLKESVYILKTIEKIIGEIDITNMLFWIKPHPTMSKEKLKIALDGKCPKEFIFIQGSSSDYLNRCNILISGMSSICLEAMALGIPVIVVEKLSGLHYDQIPKEIPQGLWTSCRTLGDIENAIECYKNRSDKEIEEHKKIGLRIKKDYFEPISRDGVLDFLNLNG